MKDMYDEAIDILVEQPDLTSEAWNYGHMQAAYTDSIGEDTARARVLFGICATDPTDDASYGCLTQVRRGQSAETPDLTDRIRADQRIPTIDMGDFEAALMILTPEERREALQPFAEWQRTLDEELNREPREVI